MPKLSVVIPFYGVEDYLEACLVSVRDQLLHDVEVILVDDGSRDGSRAIAQGFVDEDARFLLVTQENAGLGPARNAGAAHATGEYLTFLDSDDLLTARGYWTLVTTLEATGSDFAAGNALRFTDAAGTYQSWTHALPFATPARRTTLAERPDLIRDRMVWNKVYRRSFWERGDFAFPPIRYEDYPVTLRAYLEARSVDIVDEHVYLWRDRESGTSITQQTGDARNAAERFESARLVMDVLHAHDAPAEVTRRVASYFARVDLVSLAGTMVSAPEADRPGLERMACELAAMIDPREASDQTQVSKLIHTALRRCDLPFARALARWRNGGSKKTLVRDVARLRDPRAASEVAVALIASRTPQHPLKERRLRSSLHAVSTNAARIDVVIDTRLNPALARHATVSAQLIPSTSVRDERSSHVEGPSHGQAASPGMTHSPSDVGAVALQVTTRESMPWGVRLHLSAALGTRVDLGHYALDLRLSLPGGLQRWRGQVEGSPDVLAGPTRTATSPPRATRASIPRAGWVQPVTQPRAGLAVLAGDEVVLAGARLVSDAFVLALPAGVSALQVHRRAPIDPLDVVVTAGAVRLDPAEMFAGDAPINPVDGIHEAALLGIEDGERRPLLISGSAGPLEVSLPDGARVQLARDGRGRALLRKLPAAFGDV